MQISVCYSRGWRGKIEKRWRKDGIRKDADGNVSEAAKL